ncbi:conserved protein of unknown function (plasmid) [Rhodovastum atsumiense]|uniref:Uncharacterized protein n=1 Tax=Rhodovastum atsumiense TaxID=504468 RepID=A0A5M6IUM2_9PROT|nr:hypothetical protein [Rhodovastum atsumiense]KAA5611649.1 hypothetical protein F1189_13900 [Rhodovastum atsumiense]CAH2606253.1 conserved protein of unknown function [Rhodovastum atsumiense]
MPTPLGTNAEADSGNVLVRVDATHFCAGLIIDRLDQRAIIAAPILAWTIGRHRTELSNYFRRKGWRATIVRGSVP